MVKDFLKWLEGLSEYKEVEMIPYSGDSPEHLEERRNGYRMALDEISSELKWRIRLEKEKENGES